MGELLEAKISDSVRIIREGSNRCLRPYVAFSGGKDSLVVAHLVHQIDPSAEMVYCDDELLYPEHVAYIRHMKDREGDRLRMVSGAGVHRGWFRPWNDDFDWWRMPEPEMEWLPRTGQHIGGLAKLAPYLGYDGVFLGLRRAESLRRAGILEAATGVDHVGRYWHINPIIDWSDADVWEYIDTHDLDYCPVYDRLSEIGVSRHHARLGPLPLSEGRHLWLGWAQMYCALIRRYGRRWTVPTGSLTRPPKGVSRMDWLEILDALQGY